jgi:iron-sulfur cluster assembly protein
MSNEVQTVKSNKVADLTLTEAAQIHLKKQLKKNMGALGVQLSLTKTGCSGLSYAFNFIDAENAQDKKVVFDDLTVYIEHKYYPYLKGLSIDFVRDGLNNKYVYDNPNQKGACGCGESFTIE